MAAGAALPGLLFCTIACILLVIVCVSSPVWEKVSFLDVTNNGATTHFGVFGYTGSKVHVGYSFAPDRLGFTDSKLDTGIIHSLTFVLVLYPVAAGLAGMAVLFGLCGACYHRAGTVFMSLLSALATLVSIVVWVISMILFSVAKHHVNDDASGSTAKYGNANWIALGAMVSLLVGFCASACGVFGHYRKHREYY
ncbi:pali-domain-containing protein [Athelia psychrophila]|uniref:Pali-domain-containing protein n=1 Tax=Athelia psychrophila TaxID=1759441 RepID=A0A166X8H4_9AGAM|nr:pali-domain-containing protein [Fibularhizoctonia sp. CBS 109695]